MNKKTGALLFVLGLSLASFVASGSPVPGFNRATAPLTSAGSTVGIRAGSTTQTGYITTAQSIAIASLAAVTPSPFPPLTFPDGISIAEVGAATNIVTDNFTGTNTGNFNGRTTTTGSKTWITPSADGGQVGHWGIASNKATPSGSNESNAILNTGAVSGTLSVTVSSKGTGVTNQGVMFRCTSGGTCLWFGFYNGACWGLGYGVAVGNGTVYTGDGCVTPLTNGDVLSVTYTGNSISATLNGSAFLSTTQSQNNTSTYAGISAGGGSVFPQFDNFGVTTVAVPTGLLITVPAGGGGVEVTSMVTLDSSLSVAGASALHAVSVTTETMTGQLTNTSAIGTPPFVLTSTTRVPNMNADLLDGLDSAAFATTTTVGALRGYLTLVGFLAVTNGSSDSGKLTVDTNTLTPKKCTVELEALGVGAGTCDYSLYDVTSSTLLCTVSVACNSSTTTVGTCTASGTAAPNDVLSFRATAPAANTSAAQSTLTCSFTQ